MIFLKYKGFLYVALIAATLAYLTSSVAGFMFAEPPRITGARPAGQATSEVSRSQMGVAITERNLFNIDKTVPAAETAKENIQANVGEATHETTFGGRLTGVTVGVNPANSRAIILMNNKDVYALKMNQPQDNMTLTDVTYQSATIERFGRQFVLKLEDNTTSQQTSIARNTSTPPRPAAQLTHATEAIDASGGTESVSLERGDLMDQLKDINTVLRSLLVSPLYVDGEFAGYRIARMQDDSPMRTLGFRPGDIINRINGEEVTNPELLFSMLQKIDDINAVSIDITRGGEKKTLFVEIQ